MQGAMPERPVLGRFFPVVSSASPASGRRDDRLRRDWNRSAPLWRLDGVPLSAQRQPATGSLPRWQARRGLPPWLTSRQAGSGPGVSPKG